MRNTENKLGEVIDMQSTGLFMFHSVTLCVSQSKIVMGKIKHGSIFVSVIMEWSWILLSSDISPNLTAGTEKNPAEHDSECSLCWPWFVLGTYRKQTARFTCGTKCIMIDTDIHGMCTNMNLHTWMIQEYVVVAALQILLRAPLFDSWLGHRLSWLMFLVNALSSFWRTNGQYLYQVTSASSSQNLSVCHTLNIVPLDAIRFKILIASLINL
jgi:hypothetical protein